MTVDGDCRAFWFSFGARQFEPGRSLGFWNFAFALQSAPHPRIRFPNQIQSSETMPGPLVMMSRKQVAQVPCVAQASG